MEINPPSAQKKVSRQRLEQIRNPKAHNARVAVHHAVKSGRLVRPKTCERCGLEKPKIQGHHPDYNKPLKVRWLCQSCHWVEHPHKKRPRKVVIKIKQRLGRPPTGMPLTFRPIRIDDDVWAVIQKMKSTHPTINEGMRAALLGV